MSIDDVWKRRANFSARFEVPFLTYDQIEKLPPKDEENEARKAAIDAACFVKLVVTRIPIAERQNARNEALIAGELRSGGNPEVNNIVYATTLHNLLWVVIMRHIDHVLVRNEKGEWIQLEDNQVRRLFDDNEIEMQEKAMVVNRYLALYDADRKKAEGDQNFTEPVS